MLVGIGSDHGGYSLKEEIKSHLEQIGVSFMDFGTDSVEPTDYPLIACDVAEAVSEGRVERGIVVCGTGIGVCIAANKVPGIRAALCHDTFSARASRQHNNANVLTMGARVIGPGLALDIVDAFLNTGFEDGGRHARRVGQISEIERSRCGRS